MRPVLALLVWADYELEYGDQEQGPAKQREAQEIVERADATKQPNLASS